MIEKRQKKKLYYFSSPLLYFKFKNHMNKVNTKKKQIIIKWMTDFCSSKIFVDAEPLSQYNWDDYHTYLFD